MAETATISGETAKDLSICRSLLATSPGRFTWRLARIVIADRLRMLAAMDGRE